MRRQVAVVPASAKREGPRVPDADVEAAASAPAALSLRHPAAIGVILEAKSRCSGGQRAQWATAGRGRRPIRWQVTRLRLVDRGARLASHQTRPWRGGD